MTHRYRLATLAAAPTPMRFLSTLTAVLLVLAALAPTAALAQYTPRPSGVGGCEPGDSAQGLSALGLPSFFGSDLFRVSIGNAVDDQNPTFRVGDRIDGPTDCPTSERTFRLDEENLALSREQTATFEQGRMTEYVVRQLADRDNPGFTSTSSFSYDAAGRLTVADYGREVGLFAYEGGRLASLTFEGLTRVRFLYGSGSSLTEMIIEQAFGSEWDLDRRYVFAYDDQDRPTEQTFSRWNAGRARWEVDRGLTLTYDAQGRPVTLASLDGDNGTLRPDSRTTVSYSGGRTSQILREEIDRGQSEERERTVYRYDAQGRLEEALSTEIDSNGEPARQRLTYTYGGGALVEFVSERESRSAPGTLENDRRFRFEVDGEGRPLVAEEEYWNNIEWVLSDRREFEYGVTVSTGPSAPGAVLSLRVGPNPTRGPASVWFTPAAPVSARLSVHDVLGREVAVLHDGPLPAGDASWTWDAAGVPAGVYVVRLTAGSEVRTQRVTVVR